MKSGAWVSSLVTPTFEFDMMEGEVPTGFSLMNWRRGGPYQLLF